MPKEDYLIKYLEKLARVIAAMLGLRQQGLPEESISLADETFDEILGLKTDDLANLPLADFIQLIEKQNFTCSYLEALAQLTYETGKAFTLKKEDEKAKQVYKKSLETYQILNKKDKTFSFEREAIISELENIQQ